MFTHPKWSNNMRLVLRLYTDLPDVHIFSFIKIINRSSSPNKIETYFAGDIKNKSEFEILLKQLGE